MLRSEFIVHITQDYLMWFIFGLITLVSFSIYFGYRRIHASWKGEDGKSEGIEYQYKVTRNKHGITNVLVGIDGPSGCDYTFKRETVIDRFLKV